MTAIRVLLIDDDDNQYAYVRALLESIDAQRYEVVWAATYAEGVRRLVDEAFDVALVDHRLGGRSGLTLIEEVAAAGRGGTPLILFTGYGDRALDLEAMAAGAADYLNKAELTPELLDRALRYTVRHARAMRLLHEREQRFQAVVSSVPMAIWALDAQGTITFADGRLVQRFGGPRGQMVGRSERELFPDRPDVQDAIARALRGEHVHLTTKLADGVFELWYSPLPGGTSRDRALGVALEITDRLKLEEQLRQAQKMEAVGRLAGGVAHDFNNLLTAILGYGELAMSALPAGSTVRADVEEMFKAGQSAAGLTRQLLAFSRRQVLQPQVLDMNAVVLRMEALLQRVIGEDVALDTDLEVRLWPVYADPSQIEQIVMNLAVNARDAMPGGGRLTIRTRNVLPDAPGKGRPGAPGPSVVLSLSDSGTGMTLDVRRRLFEPFFTTKERGKGTGLGLATVYGIVSQTGGFIDVQSEVGRGSTFSIHLPATTIDRPAGPPRASRSTTEIRGTETVLVVEDQAQVRAVARDILERHGYRVLQASGPPDALEIVRQPGPIHLLLTDIVLPEMSGRALAELIATERPGLKVLYTSGYPDDRMLHHGIAQAGLPFVQKPFSTAVLLTKVRDVLNAARGPLVGGSGLGSSAV